VRTAACTALNETIDLGSGTLVSVRDCALLIGGFMGRSHLLEFDPVRDRLYEEVKAADTRPAAERLGWRATTALGDGLKRTIAAFESKVAASRSHS
jgi:UDP-glucose 4-epimerase